MFTQQHQLDGRQAADRREATVQLHLGKIKHYNGPEIYSIGPLGIVIAVGPSRILYPWQVVVSFTYHHDDIPARKVIQGY